MSKNKPQPRTCRKCGGEGVVYFPPSDEFPNGGVNTCPECGGSGSVSNFTALRQFIKQLLGHYPDSERQQPFIRLGLTFA